VKIRIPLIPQITDDRENLVKLADFLHKEFGNYFEVNLLPYNWLAKAKYKYVYIHDAGTKKFEFAEARVQTKENLIEMKKIFSYKRISTEVVSLDSN